MIHLMEMKVLNGMLNHFSLVWSIWQITLHRNIGGKYGVIVRTDRNIGRVRKDGYFEDAPDTLTGAKSELRVAKKIAPALILLRQEGKEEIDNFGVHPKTIIL
ncbi:hypothetical protein [Bacillus cereus]|uniref:hypothetical protein n=1 Tax=Bacillus cereus TaxID=1396 RepID=UPI00124D61C3|nr:hypothetical protein [Bacillus cereus]KAB2482775.1 hypothetical protein F8159_05410 [Bacillus cereus]